MNSITLATLNMCGIPFFSEDYHRRISKIAELFNKSGVDIIQLQEVFTYDHLLLLKSKLTNYTNFIFSPYIIGPKGGIVTISRIPLEKVTYHTFKKSGFMYDMSLIQILMRKGILITKLQKKPVWLLNTHFTANSTEDWSDQSKYFELLKSQILEFLVFFNIFASSPKTLVASGDFNIAKDSVLGHLLHNNKSLINIFAKDSSPTIHREYMKNGSVPQCIDYIFINTNKNIIVKSSKKIFLEKISLSENKKIYLSDHIGLQTTLQLP